MANFYHNLFPSGTIGALLSFRNGQGFVDDFKISIITEACELKLTLNIQADADYEKNRDQFLSINCRTCSYYKSDYELLSDLLIVDPDKFKRKVKDIKTAFNLVRKAGNKCSGILGFEDSEVKKCLKGLSVEEFNTDRLFATVDVPTLMMTCSIYRDDRESSGLIKRESDLIALLSGRRAIYYKSRWSLFRYWEPNPESDKKVPLFKAYRLTNVYGDGRICWGENPGNYNSFKAAVTSFWASRCNLDLHDSERDYGHGLKVALESYECKPEGRGALTVLHPIGKTIGKKGPCKGFILTDSKNFTSSIPKEKLVEFSFSEGSKSYFFGWVVKSRPGAHLIDCRGFMVQATTLGEDAVLTPVGDTPKPPLKVVPQSVIDALSKNAVPKKSTVEKVYNSAVNPAIARPQAPEWPQTPVVADSEAFVPPTDNTEPVAVSNTSET